MNFLVDECVPRPIIRFLASHIVRTVQEMGWGSFTNGQLLKASEGSFGLLITSDQNIRYQQNLQGSKDCHPDALDKPLGHHPGKR